MKIFPFISFLMASLMMHAQSVFSLLPPDTSIFVQIQDPTQLDFIYDLGIEIKNVSDDTLQMIWRKEIPSDCPPEWGVQISDSNISYPPNVFSNYDLGQSNNHIPVVIPPNQLAQYGFLANLYPASTLGCCTVPVHFSLLDEPDSILATAYFKYKLGNTDCSTVSVKETEKASIEISPNPTAGFFNIKSTTQLAGVNIFNLQGVRLETIKNNLNQVDVSDLPSGIYFLEINLKNGKSVWRKVEKI
ncbi:MAG: T9SS type A sorting domain-containing protein [Saprospiraceae bacterium]